MRAASQAAALRLLGWVDQALARARFRLGAPSGPTQAAAEPPRVLDPAGSTPKTRRAELQMAVTGADAAIRDLGVLEDAFKRRAVGEPAAAPPRILTAAPAAPAAAKAESAAAPAAPAPSHGMAPRVLELIAEIGVNPTDFHRLGSSTGPRVQRALAARRAVVQALHAEGLTDYQIADACQLNYKTVAGHLRAAKARAAKTESAAAPAPAADPTCGLAPRVLVLLGEIGVAPEEFHRPQLERAVAARRAVIQALRAEGLTLNRIAEACALNKGTVWGHLQAAKARARAGKPRGTK